MEKFYATPSRWYDQAGKASVSSHNSIEWGPLQHVKTEIDHQEGEIYITYRQSCVGFVSIWPSSNQAPEDKYWLYTYGVKDGRLSLLRTVEGKMRPAEIEWNE